MIAKSPHSAAPAARAASGEHIMAGARRISRVVPGTSLLPVPFAIASAVLVLLAATLTLDAYASAGTFALPSWLSVGNVDDARVILGAILGTVSTVLALIFSVTLLVFSMAATQFGPRLMPCFLRQRTTQVALGLFLATFLHSLATLVVTASTAGVSSCRRSQSSRAWHSCS